MGCEKISSILYHGGTYIGEVCIYPQHEETSLTGIISKEIHISYFSCQSKRCPPLVVLHSIASNGVCFKMESKEQQSQADHENLNSLYKACLQEKKTAVIPIGGNELHLVAMLSADRHDQMPCFWGFSVVSSLYDSCLRMLNLRCLAIVFDLDETLIVANTLRSFEDRIEALERKILGEVDPQRVAGMKAEINRYQEDQKILKQFVESDNAYDNGKLIKAQSEIVPRPLDNHLPLVRPIIRLSEQNIILTRINPNIRDTSVLVRMRPFWEELRNYLIANGRKRFEVFVCTMSEKDYALEMWRLLDPEATLISTRELHDRVICVKPGFRKSLVNVFINGICHPKIAMVIDDRLKVWEDIDQSCVHVVPAFAPYYAPSAETSNPVPVLRVARNVACNVRGGFFKNFDEDLFQRMGGVFYESDTTNLPATPEVSNYLVTEDEAVANNNTDLPVPRGMTNSAVEKKLNLQDQILLPKTGPASVFKDNQDPKLVMQLLHQAKLTANPPSSTQTQSCDKVLENSHGVLPAESFKSQPVGSEPSNNGSPGREEGEIPESEMDQIDPDERRRLLILQHGQDPGHRDFNSYDTHLLKSILKCKFPPNQHHVRLGGGDGNICTQLSITSQGCAHDSKVRSFDVQHSNNNSFYYGPEKPFLPNRNNGKYPNKSFYGDDKLKHEYMLCDYPSVSGNHRRGEKHSRDLQLSMGLMGAPKEDESSFASTSAQSKCIDPVRVNWYTEDNQKEDEDQHSRETKSSMIIVGVPCADDIGFASTSAHETISKQRADDNSKGSYNPVDALKELCAEENLKVEIEILQPNGFQSVTETHARVKVAGQILGESSCPSWEGAMSQASEEALKNLRANATNQRAQKQLNSTRTVPDQPNKRIKQGGLLQVP